MATAAIGENGRVWRQRIWFPATGWWYWEHSVATVRTVGYTSQAAAETAAGEAAGAGVVATWQLDAPGLWSVTVETDTVGEMTQET